MAKSTKMQTPSKNWSAGRNAESFALIVEVKFAGTIDLFVELFMVVLHCGHLLRRLAAILFLAKFHDVVVCVGRQDADEGHHATHKTAPAWAKAVVFRLIDHGVHGHHGTFHEGVLRESWHGICVLAYIARRQLRPRGMLVLHFARRIEGGVCGGLLSRGTDAHSAALTWTILLRGCASAARHSHALLHALAGRHRCAARHGADAGGHLVHHVVREMAMKHPVARIVGDKLHIA